MTVLFAGFQQGVGEIGVVGGVGEILCLQAEAPALDVGGIVPAVQDPVVVEAADQPQLFKIGIPIFSHGHRLSQIQRRSGHVRQFSRGNGSRQDRRVPSGKDLHGLAVDGSAAVSSQGEIAVIGQIADRVPIAGRLIGDLHGVFRQGVGDLYGVRVPG